MQSELSAAKEDLARLRRQLNRAEERIAKLEEDEKKKRDREAREGVDMVEPDWNTPDFARYQLSELTAQAEAKQKMIDGYRNALNERRERRRLAHGRDERHQLDLEISDIKRRLGRKEEELETIQRRINQQRRRLVINARVGHLETKMNNMYV